jgi:surfeit locus 1 family protein
MRVGQRRFRPRLAALALLFLPACLCVALGFWQLERADEKRRLAAELAHRAAAPPLAIGDAPLDPEATRYRRVQATGRFEAAGQVYIENRHHAGKLGFHVITPLQLAGSERRVLVNRGWVAEMPAPVPEGEVTVNGIADVPSAPALALHGSAEAAKGWGTRWPYLTLPLYAAFRPVALHDVIVLQDPAGPHGFARHWPRELPKEGMHLGYALQWFAFAAIAFVLFVRLSLVRDERPGEGRG